MKRKILLGLILLSLIACLIVGVGRYRLEQTSSNVEIVLDYEAFTELADESGVSNDKLLGNFKDWGVTSVAVYDQTVKDLQKDDQLMTFTGDELLKRKMLTGRLDSLFANLFQEREDRKNLYLLFTDLDTYDRFNAMISRLPVFVLGGKDEDRQRQLFLVEIQENDKKILNKYLGFDVESIREIDSAGLKVVLRPGERTDAQVLLLEDILAEAKARGEISQIIFSGMEVVGYPNQLHTTAQIIEKAGLQVGMVEPFIGDQKGIRELANLLDLDITRVHSLQQKEMEAYSLEKTVDRYVRAVEERNVRTLYYRPILEAKGSTKPVTLNKELLTDLQKRLKDRGYHMGVAKPFPNKRTGIFWVLIISMGVYAAGLLLLERFIKIPDLVEYILLGAGLIVTLALTWKGYVILTRSLVGLLAAVTYSSLAVIYGYEQALTNHQQGSPLWQALLTFLKVTGITLVGALAVVGLYSDVRYIYQIELFRGIKAVFLFPLGIIGLYYLKEYLGLGQRSSLKEGFQRGMRLLQQPVRYSHLIIFGILGIAGLIYIGRTGNFPILPISSIEIKLRDFLEEVFIYRPRFKEFAIGHPIMILALYYLFRGKRKYILPLILLGAIGQVTVMDTFAHIHTPVFVSLTRVVAALILGIVGGLILSKLYAWVSKYIDKLSGWLYD